MRGRRSTQLAELSKHGCLSTRPCPGPSCNPSPLLLPCAGVGNAPLAEAQVCRLGPGTAASHGPCGRRGSRPRVQGFQRPGPAVRHAVVARSSKALLVVTVCCCANCMNLGWGKAGYVGSHGCIHGWCHPAELSKTWYSWCCTGRFSQHVHALACRHSGNVPQSNLALMCLAIGWLQNTPLHLQPPESHF